MKPLFIIPLVLMSLVSFPSWGLTMDDLVEREGLYYEKFTDIPFTGKSIKADYRAFYMREFSKVSGLNFMKAVS